MNLVLLVVGIVLAVVGLLWVLNGHIVLGILLILFAVVIGPGGYSLGRR